MAGEQGFSLLLIHSRTDHHNLAPLTPLPIPISPISPLDHPNSLPNPAKNPNPDPKLSLDIPNACQLNHRLDPDKLALHLCKHVLDYVVVLG